MKGEPILEVFYQPNLVLFLKIFEVVSFIFVSSFLAVYFNILIKKQVCHNNLRILLICQPFSHWLALFIRIIRHGMELFGLLNRQSIDITNLLIDIIVWVIVSIFTFASPVTVLFSFHDIRSSCRKVEMNNLGITTGLMLMFSIERIIAMVYMEKYENMFTPIPTLGIGLTCAMVVFCIIFETMWNLGILITNEILFSFFYACFGIATVFFILLRIISKQAYKKVAAARYSTVPERFQAGRNLKASELLMYIAPFKSITNFLSLFIYGYVNQNMKDIYMPLCFQLYYIFNHIQLCTILFLVIVCHSVLRKELCKMIGRKRKESNLNPNQIRSLGGSKMIFTINEPQNIYFSKLQHSWDLHLPSSESNIPPLPKIRQYKVDIVNYSTEKTN